MPLKIEIDVDALTLGDIEALENAKRVGQMLAWFEKCAQADPVELRKLPVKELRDVVRQVQQQLDGAFALPKASGTL